MEMEGVKSIRIVKHGENKNDNRRILSRNIAIYFLNVFGVICSVLCMTKSLYNEKAVKVFNKATLYPLDYLSFNGTTLSILTFILISILLMIQSLGHEQNRIKSIARYMLNYTICYNIVIILVYWSIRLPKPELIISPAQRRIRKPHEILLEIYTHGCNLIICVVDLLAIRKYGGKTEHKRMIYIVATHAVLYTTLFMVGWFRFHFYPYRFMYKLNFILNFTGCYGFFALIFLIWIISSPLLRHKTDLICIN
ncbi:hypothetical protein ECANGB1_2085 [Enterospora canceri]|uniref:Uncharacterized protein n=1 Tax=Enterospora canceri TaxID=1081671 RepID=A0A1Y1S9Z5_9MICR|nr:hypothetical protein ECANGB1_2085 [Enterospora canceri]